LCEKLTSITPIILVCTRNDLALLTIADVRVSKRDTVGVWLVTTEIWWPIRRKKVQVCKKSIRDCCSYFNDALVGGHKSSRESGEESAKSSSKEELHVVEDTQIELEYEKINKWVG
jgi:hypothetical protein